MTLLQQFIHQYQEESQKAHSAQQAVVTDAISCMVQTLLSDRFLPSLDLKQALERFCQRAKNPINIAIVGQFSAGKSTFLNAILSKAILPTGVTPVTSKVCRIGYGQEFALKVLFEDGQSQWHAIEDIFHLEDTPDKKIVEFHLKAPIAFLKDINFLDTPGFNSQRESDTATTQRILESVDGIIWLTLIDNAGKQSELEILETFMHNYAHKSLCVLNQKDRLSNKEEIDSALTYVKSRFERFFADVVAVSSLMALRSKGFDQENVTIQAMSNLARKIAHLSYDESNQETIDALWRDTQKEIEKFSIVDAKDAQALYEESGFVAVMDFINEKIRPTALEAKEFGLKQEMNRILEILLEQYRYLEEILKELQDIVLEYEKGMRELLGALKNRHKKELHALAQEFHYHIEDIAETIFSHVGQKTKEILNEQKGFLGSKVEKTSLMVPSLDLDRINEKLFLADSKNIKFFKNFQIKIRKVSGHLQATLNTFHDDFSRAVQLWQERSEFVQKRHALMSSVLFDDFKHYVLKAHEDIFKSFFKLKEDMENYIYAELDGINVLLGSTHIKLTELTLMAIERRMNASVELHLKDPKGFKVFIPSFEEIKTMVEESFAIASYLGRIEGEETVADRLYQKIYIAYEKAFVEEKERLSERIEKFQEKHKELLSLQEEMMAQKLLQS